MRVRAFIVCLLVFVALGQEARAIPVFAHRYGLSCQICHTTVPHLTPFGQAFLRVGFRLPPSFPAHGTFPVSVKVNVQYQSMQEPQTLPKVVLDELEFLSAASLTSHLSYRLEQYAVDGGFPGLTRDAWLFYTNQPAFGSRAAALRATAGQFTLPLPVDPETQRETLKHYAVFDQAVGANPFNLFDDRIGVDAAYGYQIRGLDVQALAMKGHDPQSGLPTSGVDNMFTLQSLSSSLVLSVYHYQGWRPLGPVSDEFYRQALAANVYWGKAQIDLLAQMGKDTSANGFGFQVGSQGGFGQMTWYFSPGLTGVVRYDSTSDILAGRAESVTTTLIYRLRPNQRVTVEDVSGFGKASVNAAWLFAY
jgi:hypothetical protein